MNNTPLAVSIAPTCSRRGNRSKKLNRYDMHRFRFHALCEMVISFLYNAFFQHVVKKMEKNKNKKKKKRRRQVENKEEEKKKAGGK